MANAGILTLSNHLSIMRIHNLLFHMGKRSVDLIQSSVDEHVIFNFKRHLLIYALKGGRHAHF